MKCLWDNGNGGFSASRRTIVPQRKEKACVTHAGVCCNLLVSNRLLGVGSCRLHDPTPDYIGPDREVVRSARALQDFLRCLDHGVNADCLEVSVARFGGEYD